MADGLENRALRKLVAENQRLREELQAAREKLLRKGRQPPGIPLSEETLIAILESSPFGIGISRLSDSTIMYSNSPLNNIFGIPLVGNNARGYWADPLQREVLVREFSQGVKLPDREVRLKKADGTVFWSYLTWEHIDFQDEDCILFWVYDISSFKRVEDELSGAKARLGRRLDQNTEALRRSEETFSKAFHNSPTIGVIGTLRGRVLLEVNRKFVELLGYTRDDVVGKTIDELQLFAEPDVLGRLQRLAAADGHIKDFELLMNRKGGGTLVGLVSAEIIEVENEKCLMVDIQDITERKQAEDELRRSEEKLRTTLNSIGDAVIAADTGGSVIRMNPVAEALTGWSLEEARGKPLAEVFQIINGRTRAVVLNPVTRVLEEGETVGLVEHTLLIARAGQEYQIADSAAPIRGADGTMTGVVLVFRDVTEDYARQEALKEAAQRQRDLLNKTSSVIYIKDVDGRYLFINRMYEQLFHVSDAEIHGKTDYDRFPQEMADAFRANDLKVAEADTSLEFEEIVPQDDGEHTYISVKFSLKKVSGEVYAVCGISTDITQRKRAEDELRASEVRYRTLFEKSTDAILIIEGDRFVDCNRATVEMLRYQSKEELLLTHPSELSPACQPDGRLSFEKANAMIAIAFDHGSHRFEWDHKRADGEVFPVEVLLTAIPGRGEQILHVVWRDITERKQAGEELRQLRNYLVNIIDSMPSVLIGVDATGTVTQWNRGAELATGEISETAVGQPLLQAFPRLADEMQRVREAIRTRQKQVDPKRVFQQNGETRFEDVTIFPLIANGIEGAVIRVDDVTERVRIEEMMVQSEKMLSVGGLAAGMAHEINNPLAGMMQTVEVLARRLTADLPVNVAAAAEAGTSMAAIRSFTEARGVPLMIGQMREAGERAAAIVTNMLNFARKSSDATSSDQLPELLDRCIDLASSDYDLKKKYDFRQIEIVRDYEKGLPPVTCEAGTIQQVMLNILRNGAEAMQECRDADHGPRFILRIAWEEAVGMVRVEIEDNGPGMDETICKRIFEPFFTTKPEGVGTGLGLSVSYFIITEIHGGEMDVTSRPGEGTTFILRLPAAGKST